MLQTNNSATPNVVTPQPTVASAVNGDLLQIEEYFSQHYLFRNNVLSGKYEVAKLTGHQGEKAEEMPPLLASHSRALEHHYLGHEDGTPRCKGCCQEC